MSKIKTIPSSFLSALVLVGTFFLQGEVKANWVPNLCQPYCEECWAGAEQACERIYCNQEDPCLGTSMKFFFCLMQSNLCEDALTGEEDPCFKEKANVTQCKNLSPFCGDGLITGNEQCEDPSNMDPTCQNCKREP